MNPLGILRYSLQSEVSKPKNKVQRPYLPQQKTCCMCRKPDCATLFPTFEKKNYVTALEAQ